MSKQEKRVGQSDENIGNVWGWKFSLFGLALILLMLSLMIYRHVTLDVPFGNPTDVPQKDSTTILIPE